MPDPECQRLIEVINKKDLKINELKQKIKTCKNQIKELNEKNSREKEKTNKTKEDLEGKIDQFKKEIIELKKEIEELKEELKRKEARMDSLENTMEENKESQRQKVEELKNTVKENEESHQREMQALKDGYKDDLSKFEDRYTKRVEELCKSHKKEMKELEDYRTAYEMSEDDLAKLYLGQLCVQLQRNLYRYVLPEHYARDGFYRIKDIQNDMDDLLNDKEKREAEGRLKTLKEKIDWEELEKLVKTMKQLLFQRNRVAHPDNVDEDGARRAAKELDKNGQLKGQTSIERVNKIIEIWSISKKLPKSI